MNWRRLFQRPKEEPKHSPLEAELLETNEDLRDEIVLLKRQVSALRVRVSFKDRRIWELEAEKAKTDRRRND